MILIHNDGYHAHYFERFGWHKALVSADIESSFYSGVLGFDSLDIVQPSIIISQLYNINGATVKYLRENPFIKLILRSGHHSDVSELMSDPNMLCVNHEQIKILEELNSFLINKPVIYCHYLQKHMHVTHGKFEEMRNKVLGVPMSADICTYLDGQYSDDLACDIAFVGGYWPYKGKVIDKYLTPLLQSGKYSAKVFGNQPWPHVNQYCGLIADDTVKHLFASAEVCPNLSEPHAQTHGFDLNERAFKILSSGGVCVMDKVEAAQEMLGKYVFIADDEKMFGDIVEDLIRNPVSPEFKRNSRNFIVNNHSNFHRIASIMESIGEYGKSKGIMDAHNNYI